MEKKTVANIFQTVKEAVTAKDAAMYYGIRVNRSNMACCPFHDDHHPSMKVDKGFICFACGEKGDVITFVSKLFGLSPYEATKKKALYEAYCKWCGDNMEKPLPSITGYLRENKEKYGIHYSTNIPSETGKKARGFMGIHVLIRTNPF